MVRGRGRSKALASAVEENSFHKGDNTYEYYEGIPVIWQDRCGNRKVGALYARRHPEQALTDRRNSGVLCDEKDELPDRR